LRGGRPHLGADDPTYSSSYGSHCSLCTTLTRPGGLGVNRTTGAGYNSALDQVGQADSNYLRCARHVGRGVNVPTPSVRVATALIGTLKMDALICRMTGDSPTLHALVFLHFWQRSEFRKNANEHHQAATYWTPNRVSLAANFFRTQHTHEDHLAHDPHPLALTLCTRNLKGVIVLG
jgi:hypothetical protein